jgi:hypothetical protein
LARKFLSCHTVKPLDTIIKLTLFFSRALSRWSSRPITRHPTLLRRQQVNHSSFFLFNSFPPDDILCGFHLKKIFFCFFVFFSSGGRGWERFGVTHIYST